MGGQGDRITRLLMLIEDKGIDAVVFFSPENIRYLSGFRGEGVLLMGRDQGYLISDGRYLTQAEEESPIYLFA